MAWPGPVLPYISNVLVHPHVRRRGLANRLMLRCEEQAREWGFSQVSTILLGEDYRTLLMARMHGALENLPTTAYFGGREPTSLCSVFAVASHE